MTKGMEMTKRPFVLIIIVAALLALHGCTMSGSKMATDANKVPDNLTFPPPPEVARYYFERSIHSSSDVHVDTDADKFRRAMTGERAKGEGLAKPYGIAVNRGRMFVGDTILKNVAVFDFPQQKFFRIGDDEDDIRLQRGGRRGRGAEHCRKGEEEQCGWFHLNARRALECGDLSPL